MARRKYKRRKSRKKNPSFKGLILAIWNYVKWVAKAVTYATTGIYYILKKTYQGIKFLISKLALKKKEEPEKKAKRKAKAIGRDSSGAQKFQISSESKFQIMESIEGNIIKFERNLENNKSTIGIILGARGQGKSALGMRLLENIYSSTKRPCAAMGFGGEKLPRWIKQVDDIEEVPNGSFVLIDEGGILFSSRDSMSDANKVLSSLLLIARHKDISIVFISQNSSNLELNIIRQADYMLLKPSSLMQIDFERKKIQTMYKDVAEQFEMYKSFRGLTYVYSNIFRGFISNDLPSFWNEEVSKAFKNTKQ